MHVILLKHDVLPHDLHRVYFPIYPVPDLKDLPKGASTQHAQNIEISEGELPRDHRRRRRVRALEFTQ